nr:MAG TPA: hypothetical protein [Caudoviricetes sp.]
MFLSLIFGFVARFKDSQNQISKGVYFNFLLQ